MGGWVFGLWTLIFRLQVIIRCLIAGGNWDNSSSCGSRSRNANNARSIANANNGGRSVIRSPTMGMAEFVTLSQGKIRIDRM